MKSSTIFISKAIPFLAVIFLQFGLAGMSIISKFALDSGMSPHVLVVYRHLIATIVIAPFALYFDRGVRRPRMTLSIFIKIVFLGLLEPTIDQNLYYTGMKYTTATFASSMTNILPAFAFLMAYALRLEKVNLRRIHSLAKIFGTTVTVCGAMLMTLYNGAILNVPWTKGHNHHDSSSTLISEQDQFKGSLMIVAGCLSWSGFIILQAITLKSYPAELSLTALICLMGTIEGGILAAILERGNPSAWSIGFDSKLLAAVYSGIICSGIAYYVQGVIMRYKGPVFVTSFSPLSMIIVTIMGSFLLSETLYLGRIIGAVVIVIGLYMVLWGKSKDEATFDSSKDKVAPTSPEVEIVEGNIVVSNEEFLAIDVDKVRPTNASV